MQYFLVLKREELLLHSTTWIDLEGFNLSEVRLKRYDSIYMIFL